MLAIRLQAPLVSELFCHAGNPAARLVPFQPMAHGLTLLGIRHPELQVNRCTCSYPYQCKVARETSTPDTFQAISQR